MSGLEGFKQFHDSLKHLTTLSTAAIGVVFLLMEKLFPQPEWKWLVLGGLFLLIGSLFFSVSAMLFQSLETMNKEALGRKYSDARWERVGTFMALAYYGFFGAVTVLGIFFVKNYF